MDSSSIQEKITRKIMKLAFNQICATLFSMLCPNYTNQPHAAVDVIKQSYMESEGNRVSTSIFAYHMHMILAMRPFISLCTFPVSVCNKFMQGLDPRILSYFEGFYPAHNEPHELDGQTQPNKLHLIYMTAIKVENVYNVTTAAAREDVGAAYPSYCAMVPALPSQAENTLRQYDNTTASPATPATPPWTCGKCFGCKSTLHLWMDKKGNIIYPKKDNPNIRDIADAAHTAWLKDQQQCCRGGKEPDDIDYESLSDKL